MRHLPTSLARFAALSLIVLASAGGCAYYNTFYIAKKNYREAQKAQEKSLTDAPAAEAISKYEIVIRQCKKMQEEHPKSKWADDAGYLMGASLYGKGDYAGALKKLGEFRERFPKSPFRSEARFTEGLARYRRKEFGEADSIFRELHANIRDFPRKWELHFYAGETQSALKNYDAANWWYARALKEAGGRREKGNTLRRSADAYLAAERPDTAQVVYDEALKVEERGLQRVEVAMARGEALRQLGKYPEALRFLDDWRAYAAEVGKEGELMLRVYELMALSGRVPEAIQGYRGLVEKFPRTPVAYESQFQIGFLHETALGDLDGAGREYDKLKTQPGSQFQTQAVRRSQNLSTLKQYRTAMASDTTQAAAKAAFLLAELYYFQLEKADSAMLLYRKVEAEFPTSVFAPKSAYARLWIRAYDRQDTLGAMALTDSIADRYRGTRHAESALYLWKRWSGRVDERTALLDSLLANPDTSRYAAFEPEPELKLPPIPTSSDTTTAAMRAGYQATVNDSARMEALRAARQRELERRGTPGGAQAPTPSPSPSPQPPAGDPVAQPPQQQQAAPPEEEEDLEEDTEDGAGP
ncbi:MAG TPA: tetratricopeptide repeat protein [Candidatus Eisenbacteria bacterium]|nr:tetratricopeptide repeat protein [Candidatus Eisenbacteria bacterium]